MTEKSKWQLYKESLAQANPLDLLNKVNHIDKESAAARMAICQTCPELISMTNQCKKCGCFMNMKTKLIAATCPLNKWQ
jgi:hypothetical protein